ncbi:CFC_HP_G0063240.mRNA.1.CDS.1 [Saccharomyces cerevisiae]|nr:CFC_HP_G0063240.mRNA.1.CDS.1 [Saccharomyces cerevisiae]CAI6599155.1 CFC_HP_G0063240.mRNA.1.CDS.1 [Saccharomyces cerevisiae]
MEFLQRKRNSILFRCWSHYYGDERQGQLHTFEQDGSEINDNEFENEDFNKHIEQPIEVTPRNNAYLPEFEPNRPVLTSFKGLKALRMNTFIDSMTPDSANQT